MAKWIATFLLVLISGLGSIPAFAADVGMTPAMQALPFQTIGTYKSAAGEDLHTFLLRIAPVLADFTHAHGWEACGTIGKAADGTYGVVLGSNDAQIGCLAGEAGVPDGMTWTGETIHSHPESSTLDMGPTDRAYAKATGTADPYARQFYGSPKDFSSADFTGEAGYLVADGRLLYQPGHRIPHGRFIGDVALTGN